MEGPIGTEHEEGAMGEIDDAHDTEGEREPAGDEKQQHSELQSVEDLHENGADMHGAAQRSPSCPALCRASTSKTPQLRRGWPGQAGP